MKRFVKNVLTFCLTFLMVVLVGLFAPCTPRNSNSLLFAKVAKDSLLQNSPSPRLILIGGSNLSFGINSNILKDSLRYNPINTAIHASIGLKFMLIINQNNLIAVVTKGGFKDKRYPNALRIVQANLSDLKKILINNRQLIDHLKIPNFASAEVFDNLNFSQYQNDEMIRLGQKNNRNKSFKQKTIDNLTQSVVLLNECYTKVAALYSKIK